MSDDLVNKIVQLQNSAAQHGLEQAVSDYLAKITTVSPTGVYAGGETFIPDSAAKEILSTVQIFHQLREVRLTAAGAREYLEDFLKTQNENEAKVIMTCLAVFSGIKESSHGLLLGGERDIVNYTDEFAQHLSELVAETQQRFKEQPLSDLIPQVLEQLFNQNSLPLIFPLSPSESKDPSQLPVFDSERLSSSENIAIVSTVLYGEVLRNQVQEIPYYIQPCLVTLLYCSSLALFDVALKCETQDLSDEELQEELSKYTYLIILLIALVASLATIGGVFWLLSTLPLWAATGFVKWISSALVAFAALASLGSFANISERYVIILEKFCLKIKQTVGPYFVKRKSTEPHIIIKNPINENCCTSFMPA